MQLLSGNAQCVHAGLRGNAVALLTKAIAAMAGEWGGVAAEARTSPVAAGPATKCRGTQRRGYCDKNLRTRLAIHLLAPGNPAWPP